MMQKGDCQQGELTIDRMMKKIYNYFILFAFLAQNLTAFDVHSSSPFFSNQCCIFYTYKTKTVFIILSPYFEIPFSTGMNPLCPNLSIFIN